MDPDHEEYACSSGTLIVSFINKKKMAGFFKFGKYFIYVHEQYINYFYQVEFHYQKARLMIVLKWQRNFAIRKENCY